MLVSPWLKPFVMLLSHISLAAFNKGITVNKVYQVPIISRYKAYKLQIFHYNKVTNSRFAKKKVCKIVTVFKNQKKKFTSFTDTYILQGYHAFVCKTLFKIFMNDKIFVAYIL